MSCYICVSYLPLTLIGYNWAMNKILNSNSTWKSTIDSVLLRLYPFLPKTALPTAQSSFTKSNDGTITAHHVAFAREKSLISLTSVKTMYIHIPSQYDIVSMAKRFHIGFYAKCKKCDEMYMCCIWRLEEEAFWATSWQNQQNDFCAQRRLRSAWASAQSDQNFHRALSG